MAPQINSNRRILTRAKANYAKAGETLELVVRDGVFLLTSVGPEAAAKPPKSGPMRNKSCDAKFLELLVAVGEQGRYVNEAYNSATHYAPKVFAEIPGGKDFSEPEYTRAMRRLLERKQIRVIEFGPQSRGWRKIVDMAAETEATAKPLLIPRTRHPRHPRRLKLRLTVRSPATSRWTRWSVTVNAPRPPRGSACACPRRSG